MEYIYLIIIVYGILIKILDDVIDTNMIMLNEKYMELLQLIIIILNTIICISCPKFGLLICIIYFIEYIYDIYNNKINTLNHYFWNIYLICTIITLFITFFINNKSIYDYIYMDNKNITYGLLLIAATILELYLYPEEKSIFKTVSRIIFVIILIFLLYKTINNKENKVDIVYVYTGMSMVGYFITSIINKIIK